MSAYLCKLTGHPDSGTQYGKMMGAVDAGKTRLENLRQPHGTRKETAIFSPRSIKVKFSSRFLTKSAAKTAIFCQGSGLRPARGLECTLGCRGRQARLKYQILFFIFLYMGSVKLTTPTVASSMMSQNLRQLSHDSGIKHLF